MTVKIRQATEDDIDAMYELTCSVHLSKPYRQLIPAEQYERFQEYYTPAPARLARFYERFISYLYDPEHLILVADLEYKVVGFTHAHNQGDQYVLKGLFVNEKYQGQGIGTQLFLKSFDHVADTPVILDVIEANARAIALYEKSGFRAVSASPETFFGAKMIRMQRH